MCAWDLGIDHFTPIFATSQTLNNVIMDFKTFQDHVDNAIDLLYNKPANATNTKKIRAELKKLDKSKAINCNEKHYDTYQEYWNDPLVGFVVLKLSALGNAISIADKCVESGKILDLDNDEFVSALTYLKVSEKEKSLLGI